jgi:hypothetical protein
LKQGKHQLQLKERETFLPRAVFFDNRFIFVRSVWNSADAASMAGPKERHVRQTSRKFGGFLERNT